MDIHPSYMHIKHFAYMTCMYSLVATFAHGAYMPIWHEVDVAFDSALELLCTTIGSICPQSM